MPNYDESPMSTGGWFLTILLLAIPLLNLILLIVWACGVGNRNRVTFCRASILWGVVILGLYLLLAVLGIGAGVLAGA